MDELPDFSKLWPFTGLTLVLFAVITLRYFLVAGLFQLIFHGWFKRHWSSRTLSSANVSKQQYFKEVKWSVVTSLIFAVTGTLAIIAWQKGFTRVYFNPHQYSLLFLPISLVASLLIHETYYYFLHRWMHLPAVFKLVHKTHHESKTTSAWTAFSFHPIESVLQAIALPLTLVILPMHLYVVLVHLNIMSISSVINHLEIEVYPSSFQKNIVGKWIIGATHHSLHHKQFKYNFGLYFTFWDKIKNTESPSFSSVFDKKTRKKETADA